jgi:hypothetical protein
MTATMVDVIFASDPDCTLAPLVNYPFSANADDSI